MDHNHHHTNNTSTSAPHDNNNNDNNMMTMSMIMHGGFEEIIVFNTWATQSIGAFIGSCIALAIIAALYEGIKSLREWLIKLDVKHLNEYSTSYSILRWNHLLQTILHMVQVAISYFLMLVVMTYNSYICGSIVIGAGLGYFCFAFKRTTTIDMNEHCH